MGAWLAERADLFGLGGFMGRRGYEGFGAASAWLSMGGTNWVFGTGVGWGSGSGAGPSGVGRGGVAAVVGFK